MTDTTDDILDAGTVQVAVADAVATIEFRHPKGNSLPGALLRQLAETITETGARDDVRAIVLQSAGTGPFCAGASFDELKSIADPDTGREFFLGFARVILAMVRCPRPIIARVHGKAVGGGVGLVAASDYAIAVESASLRLSELAVGIGPFVVGPAIERKIGAGLFGAMAIDADWRDAHWGMRAGLYAKVVASQPELDQTVAGFARKLAASNPEALTKIKNAVWQGVEYWDRLLTDRAAMSGTLVLSDFARHAINSF